MDKLVLKGLKYKGLHGYFENERIEGNDFEVDLIFHLSLSEAGTTDDISQTVDYTRAQQLAASVMGGPSVKLIETLTYNIGQLLIKEFSNLQKLDVVVRKLNPAMEGRAEYSEVHLSWPR